MGEQKERILAYALLDSVLPLLNAFFASLHMISWKKGYRFNHILIERVTISEASC